MAPWPGFEPGIARVTAEHTGPDYTTRALLSESNFRETISQIKFPMHPESVGRVVVSLLVLFGDEHGRC